MQYCTQLCKSSLEGRIQKKMCRSRKKCPKMRRKRRMRCEKCAKNGRNAKTAWKMRKNEPKCTKNAKFEKMHKTWAKMQEKVQPRFSALQWWGPPMRPAQGGQESRRSRFCMKNRTATKLLRFEPCTGLTEMTAVKKICLIYQKKRKWTVFRSELQFLKISCSFFFATGW